MKVPLGSKCENPLARSTLLINTSDTVNQFHCSIVLLRQLMWRISLTETIQNDRGMNS